MRNYTAELDNGIGARGGMVVSYQSDHRNGSKGNIADLYRQAKLQYGNRAKHATIIYSQLEKN